MFAHLLPGREAFHCFLYYSAAIHVEAHVDNIGGQFFQHNSSLPLCAVLQEFLDDLYVMKSCLLLYCTQTASTVKAIVGEGGLSH